VVSSSAALAAPSPTQRPNVVFILADDLGYGDLGCYGQKRIQTPNIDRLAAEGMRFTDAYSGSTVCAPSRCVLMTGKHTGHSTVRGNKNPELPVGPQEPTLGTVMKSAGYRTGLFGKWGLGGPQSQSLPNQMGFDEFYGFLNHWHAHLAYPEHIWHNRNEVLLFDNWFNKRQSYVPGHFFDRTLKFIEDSGTDPFFIYLSPTLPHANNELNAIEAPSQGVYAREAWPEVEKNFAASVGFIDDGVGRIMKLLQRTNLDENTLVIFTSDNGPHAEGGHDHRYFQSSGPLRGKKRDLYEGGIRVPSIARWPGRIAPSSVASMPWAFWDVLPTCAEIAGARAPAGIDGISVLPTMLGKPQKAHDSLYWEFHEGGFQQALRQGKWKLVRQLPRMEVELFDLESDPGETRNLAPANAGVVARLQALMREVRTESPVWPASGLRPSFQER
jgi:arylsulfatase A-like enzyme